MNHLEKERSPYLKQHREQPVDWYPWCAAAFTKAKEENKPILLSIGYSTCHWCHMMAKESFDDAEIAGVLNENFISIKVDREERPDVDAVYMRVCQGMTGSGGWPLTILMTPEQAPFFAGTYLPRNAFYHLLAEAKKVWEQNPDALQQTGRQLVSWLQQPEAESETQGELALWEQAVTWFESNYDKRWGGFGSAPKFPSAHTLSFLLRYAQLRYAQLHVVQKPLPANAAWQMAQETLQKMAQGGIHDQLGGGFARYSTDDRWLVPHFEKTLYDNALLAAAYSEAGYGDVAQETVDYVLRELTSEEGGFYCGQDADSEGQEGLFYLWTKQEVLEVLGAESGERFWAAYHMEGSGLPNRIGEKWEEAPLPMAAERQKLFARRKERYSLAVDDKILTAWNGLMIAALAQVGAQQGRSDYIEAAERAAAFIKTHLSKSSGRLWRRYQGGESAHMGQLSDYAYYCYGLLHLYRATHRADYLQAVVHTAQHMEALFLDPAGGYFTTAKDGEKLIARLKDTEDGAMPSGNAVAAWVLTDLMHWTGEPKWKEAAEKQLAFMSRQAAGAPAGHTFFLQALLLQKQQTQMQCCTADGCQVPISSWEAGTDLYNARQNVQTNSQN